MPPLCFSVHLANFGEIKGWAPGPDFLVRSWKRPKA